MMEALFSTDTMPEVRWEHGDDLCDCTFQRIGWWTNPYIGKTLEIRLCCAWAKLVELHPEMAEFYRLIPAFDNYLVEPKVWNPEPAEWNGEYDMPAYLWYRQIASQQGISVDEARQNNMHLIPPRKVWTNGSNNGSAHSNDRGANGGEPPAKAPAIGNATRNGRGANRQTYPTGGLR